MIEGRFPLHEGLGSAALTRPSATLSRGERGYYNPLSPRERVG
jgi:hypothetical protein